VAHSSAALDSQKPFWRELLNTVLGYLAWGYWALLLSFVSYGAYILFNWMARSPHVFALALAALFTLRMVIAIYKEVRELSGSQARKIYRLNAVEWMFNLTVILRILALVFLSWKLKPTPAEKVDQRSA
jgi:hypothetical protein